MLLEAETNKYCPGGYDFGAISNLITWVLNFSLSVDLTFKIIVHILQTTTRIKFTYFIKFT
jgi:hypothetical protein